MKKIFAILIMLGFVASLPSYSFTLDEDDYSDVLIKAKEQEASLQKQSEKSSEVEATQTKVQENTIEATDSEVKDNVEETKDENIGSLKNSVRDEVVGERWVYPNGEKGSETTQPVSEIEKVPAETKAVAPQATEHPVTEVQPVENETIVPKTTESSEIEVPSSNQKTKKSSQRPTLKK